MNHFKIIEHTADLGIEATATTCEGLAEQSGYGLKFLLYGEVDAQHSLLERLVVNGNSREETLVNWLNELLFLISDKAFVPAIIKVRHFTATEISAEIIGEQPDHETIPMLREIKAATHHQTGFEHTGNGWHSRIYLDL